MLKYPLEDFIASVAICSQTTTLAVVLDILDLEQCDRVLVVSELQSPIGLLYSARLIPQLMTINRQDVDAAECLEQPISALGLDLIEPIVALPADLCLEQFSLYLRSQSQKSNNCHYALIDPTGKFVGLLDSSRLLQFLAKRSPTRGKKQAISRSRSVSAGHRDEALCAIASPDGLQALVQLLELLPWPLMLETGNGEIVTQNPAWWQQLGVLNDPEGVRQEVKTLLSTSETQKVDSSSARKLQNVSKKQHIANSKTHQALTSVEETPRSSRRSKKSPPTPNPHIYHDIAAVANRCFIGTDPGSCTCVLQVQDGQERVWQFVKILLDSPELHQSTTKTDLWLVLATDVTEQQQLSKELVAKNADLIQLNRLKDEFLACISHELKTPLTAVLGLSSLLKDQLLGELNERQARYAGLIHQSGRHLMTVVNDILDLTRMETGQMELTMGPVTIRNACDRALTEAKSIQAGTSKASAAKLQPDIESHKFTISVEPGLDRIIADDLRLRQMLAHLLSNALKFTETGGEIGLWVSRWEGWVAFTVWDTGIGIPEQKQHLIFQKFQQLENPLTRQFEGTGLGLVLTRALARMHGGDVTFLSKEGEGSQFTLLLPPSPPSEFRSTDPDSVSPKSEPLSVGERQPKAKSQNPQQNNRLILVVEAVATYINELTEQLTGLGYRVVIARSGCEALEKARRLQPGAVFLNPLLPLLSGWDVLTLLKSDGQTRQIPVIVMGTRAEKEHAVVNRADGFMGLPIQEEVLQPLLERLFQTPLATKTSTPIKETTKPLTILHLVNPDSPSNSQPSLPNHRILEADDLEQAELLARVWHLDVVLLSEAVPNPEAFLQKLSQHPRLASLPLVTCDIATTQAASGMTKLSVFPCLIPSSKSGSSFWKTDTLLSVLQIAAGRGCPPTIAVIDLGQLSEPNGRSHSKSSEWFQALLQYLQTAGYKAAMSRSCQEVLQQIRHKSVDLLIICLGESIIHPQVHAALTALKQIDADLPPVLVLDQRLSLGEVRSSFHQRLPQHVSQKTEEQSIPLLPTAEYYDETVLDAIATQILPPSLSMEELLEHIHTALNQS
ncbi:MAG: hybrid sensor histidine kinase/response regulator [Nostocaceae cyanobacterium]|nr:hybrid sensor histidine kinase/response regulator [Nostocaceae cyanobacterium]